MAILGVDVGGTFTDAVLLTDDGELRTAKVPTAGNQADSVLAAAAEVGAVDVERFAHGTTVATNALLERKGARTAFVATDGFEHLLHLRRQNRADLYRLCSDHPEPVVPLERYFGALGDRVATAALPEPLVMRSSGGVASLGEAAAHPAIALLSGPAAGTVGAALLARRAGFENAISFDMGGTSTDVSLIVDGRAGLATEREVGGFPLRLPAVDLHTVGAGGGSIVWRDSGGALRVGPESAGADPGPACYGRGGTRPTVTDANLLLGRLPPTLAGGLELDAEAAERAVAGIDPADAIAVVNAEMRRALRVVPVEAGHDPPEFALVAFGGAGPLHACPLAEELEIGTVLVPAAAGVLSALGLVASEERRDRVVPYVRPLDEVDDLPAEGAADLRYAGQSFELTVPIQRGLAEAFHRAHEERYGYADRGRDVELVAVRTAETSPGPEFGLP